MIVLRMMSIIKCNKKVWTIKVEFKRASTISSIKLSKEMKVLLTKCFQSLIELKEEGEELGNSKAVVSMESESQIKGSS